MVRQFTGFVLISAPPGFNCPNPDWSSECCKVSRAKPVRGRGAAEPGRKVLKWSPARGGFVCSPQVQGGGGAEEGPMLGSACACVSISSLWTFWSLNGQESHIH